MVIFWGVRRSKIMSCIFCEIANGKTETEILYEDEKLVLFRDIRPAADHHFLVVPREHIINTKSLSVDHKEMRNLR